MVDPTCTSALRATSLYGSVNCRLRRLPIIGGSDLNHLSYRTCHGLSPSSSLAARGPMVGSIVHLQKSGGMNAMYFGIKGHAIVVPQDTTQLLDILPLPPSSLPDHVRVVWTGSASDTPRPHQLKHLFTVNTEKVRAALIWLKAHHTGYQSVTIDDMELDRWPPVFVTQELMDSIAQVSSSTAEDWTRGSFSVTPDDVNFEDQMFTSSAMVDVNCVSISSTS